MSEAITGAQIERVVEIVRQAAKAEIMPRFRSLETADIKTKSGQHDLVTEADLAAETYLRRALAEVFPDALIVGEESISADPSLRGKIGDAPLAVILDPVDGTWNFANALPLFGVILAITVFGRPIFGLLYDPVVDDWIIGDAARQTKLIRDGGQSQALDVSNGGDVSEMTGFIHFYLLPKEKQAQMGLLLSNIGRSWSLRCSCHEYRLIAQGRADFVISGTLNPWDHAAGVLAVEQAGGVVRMLDGRDYNAGIETGYLLAAPSEESWEQLCRAFAFLSE